MDEPMTAGDGATAAHRTVEVRWIVGGECPAAVVERFTAIGSQDPEERTDLYLATGSAALGVKCRDGGGFDVKARRDTGAVSGAGGRAAGCAASSRSGTDGASTPRASRKRTGRRGGRSPSGAGGGHGRCHRDRRPVAPGPTRPWTAGATVELAALAADGGAAAWTVAMEAWGVARDVAVDGIGQVLSAERDHLPVDGLTVERSCSYPEWLAAQGSGSGRDDGGG